MSVQSKKCNEITGPHYLKLSLSNFSGPIYFDITIQIDCWIQFSKDNMNNFIQGSDKQSNKQSLKYTSLFDLKRHPS